MNMIERLCQKDQSATLAALMLSALSAEAPINSYDDLVNFPDVPEVTCKAQDDLFALLVERGHMTVEESMTSYVEPGCIEHGVVHVQVCDIQPGVIGRSFWLEIDPVSGSIGKI